MSSRQTRVLRGLLAAGFATFVAALSHVAVGGSAPGSVGLVLALAFSSLTCIALAGRTLSVMRLSIAVALSQLVFHTLFSLGGSGDSSLSVSAGGHHGMGALSILGTTASTSTSTSTSTSSADAMMQGCSWMWAAHAVAALVTIVALHRGESAVRSIRRIAALQMLRMRRRTPFEGLVAALNTLAALCGAHAGSGAAAADAREAARAVRAAAASIAEPERLIDLGLLIGRMRHRGPPATARPLATVIVAA